MADIYEFRTAKLSYDSDNLPFTVEACIEEKWDSISYPIYLDQPDVETIPTVKHVIARIRRRYQPSSPLHSSLGGSGLILEFESAGDVFSYTSAKVVEWKLTGKLGGEMMEEVVLICE